jgi:hypothetical protein
VAGQVKYFDDPFPNCLTVENLFNWNTFMVGSFHPMQPPNRVSKFFDGGH